MAVSGISAAANSLAISPPAAQSPGGHRHDGRRIAALTDIDAQGSSLGTAPNSSGEIGNKINITA